jgi:lysozyme family protein
MEFETAFRKVIELEGGFRLHQNVTESDATYAGIYRKAHPSWEGWDYLDRGQTPPTELVRSFYKTHYWDVFDGIDEDKRYILYEFAINAGIKKATKIAQVVAGAVPDGIIGPRTIEAVNRMNSDLFIAQYTIARIKHYLDLANSDPKRYSIYLRGWLNRSMEALT